MIDFFKCPQDWLDFFYRDDVKDLLDEKDNYDCFYNIAVSKINIVFLTIEKEEYNFSSSYVSKSFQNIYKELENEGYYPVKDGDIRHWYKSGILFMNMFYLNIDLCIKIIEFLMKKSDIIWVILDTENKDEDKIKSILRDSKINYLSTNPLSKSFFGSNLFKNINKTLKKNGKDPIPW